MPADLKLTEDELVADGVAYGRQKARELLGSKVVDGASSAASYARAGYQLASSLHATFKNPSLSQAEKQEQAILAAGAIIGAVGAAFGGVGAIAGPVFVAIVGAALTAARALGLMPAPKVALDFPPLADPDFERIAGQVVTSFAEKYIYLAREKGGLAAEPTWGELAAFFNERLHGGLAPQIARSDLGCLPVLPTIGAEKTPGGIPALAAAMTAYSVFAEPNQLVVKRNPFYFAPGSLPECTEARAPAGLTGDLVGGVGQKTFSVRTVKYGAETKKLVYVTPIHWKPHNPVALAHLARYPYELFASYNYPVRPPASVGAAGKIEQGTLQNPVISSTKYPTDVGLPNWVRRAGRVYVLGIGGPLLLWPLSREPGKQADTAIRGANVIYGDQVFIQRMVLIMLQGIGAQLVTSTLPKSPSDAPPAKSSGEGAAVMAVVGLSALGALLLFGRRRA